MILVSILLIIVIFTSVILVHELGHFIAARRNGIEVEEFGIGFPPRAIGIKRGKTIYSLNWLPIGGFVRMKGEDETDTRPGTFNAASIGAKAKVLLAGVGMNFLMAYVILLILTLVGLPQLYDGQFSAGRPTYGQKPAVMAIAVGKGTPAEHAGIAAGTLVLSGNGTTFNKETDLQDFTKSHAGQTVNLVVKEHSKTETKAVKLNAKEGDVGYLGVTPLRVETQRFGVWAPIVSAGLLLQLIGKLFAALGGLVVFLVGALFHHHTAAGNAAADSVTGPIGIVIILNGIIRLGWAYVLVFVLSICVSLGAINALPLPALDGGRLFFALLRHVFKWPSLETEGMINRWGFGVLLALMVIVSIFDIKRFH